MTRPMWISTFLLALLTVALVGRAGEPDRQAVGEDAADARIAARIMAGLLAEPSRIAPEVDAGTSKGSSLSATTGGPCTWGRGPHTHPPASHRS